ncbi:transaldolase family protein [Cellulosimicrobium funkei]|uniref:transaldolase family protein n=1 Tax=Cellulosimicrobium funkei TaxID=264251 RepID=UPI003431608F
MLYIDSADRDQVERLLATGLFAGVTTNPTILRRAGLTVDDVPTVLRWARAAGAGTVFLQAVGPDETALEAHGRQLADLGPDVVVKLPATRDGLAVSRRLTREGVPVLVTAVYHASQALVADAAGAGWIAPYVGRMSDLGLDGVGQTADLHAALRASGQGCRVLAASLRDTAQVAALAARGIEDLTLSTALCAALLENPDTVAAAAQFETDARAAG